MTAGITAFVCVQALLAMCLVLVVFTMAPLPVKRRIVLTMENEREIIEKMEAGWTITRISNTCEVPVNTLYDLRKNKAKVVQYQANFGKKTKHNLPRKAVSKPRFASVNEATLTWVKQQRAAGVKVRGTEVMNAAKTFARLQDVQDFKDSDGWPCRFK